MGTDVARRAQEAATTPTDGSGGDKERALTLGEQITVMQPHFAKAMPKGLEAQQLIRDAMTCLSTTPKLKECVSQTVLGGLMTCAQLGLRPGVASLGHAWLIPFWDSNYEWTADNGSKRKGARVAQLIVGYQGFRELAQRSGQISTLIGRAVYENDEFDVDYGVADNLVHKPCLTGDRGAAVGYYSVVKYLGGGYAFWHMTQSEVERHRDRYAMARNQKGQIVGPWRDNFEEMSIKTTFRHLAKWMPKSPEFRDLTLGTAVDDSIRFDTDLDAIEFTQQPTLIEGTVSDAEPDGDETPAAGDAVPAQSTGGGA